jgi:uncharacterized protein
VTLSPGDAVRVLMTKWPDRPHSEFTGVYLGADEHGDWVGARAGTRCWRRERFFEQRSDWVTLLRQDGTWCAGFYDPALPTETYVDIAAGTVWDGASVTTVDVDLDVVRDASGEVRLEDEDDFARNRAAYDYPAEVVRNAEATCTRVLTAVRRSRAPFDGSHRAWLNLLRELVPA